MPRGTGLQRRAAPRPLLRPALRRPAAILVAGSAAVTASLALAFAGQSHANRLDSAIDGTVRGGIAGHAEPLHLLAGLGGEELVTAMTAALVAAFLVARRWRGAALAGLAVPAAPVLTESVLKPLVGRTIGSHPGYPSFPSGHATAMFALAATCAVLLAGPSRPRLPGALRLLLGLGAVLLAAAVGTSMVGLGYHYFTDIVAGAVVGIGMVLLTALVIDWAAAHPPPARRPPRIPGDAPVPSRRDHQSMTGHLITGEASRRAAVPAAQGGDARLPGNRMPPERNREAMDDDELIAAVARGDDVALRELFRRHAPWLAGRLRGVLPAAEVEDVLQETFLAVWRGAGGYRPGSAGGWLWGIARRQAALWLRRRGPAELLLPALIAVDGRDPGDPAEAALSRAELAHAVSALGPEGGAARETWRLMYVEDKTVAEVAELMGVSAGTVKSRAHRARRLMRAALRHRAPARQGGGR